MKKVLVVILAAAIWPACNLEEPDGTVPPGFTTEAMLSGGGEVLVEQIFSDYGKDGDTRSNYTASSLPNGVSSADAFTVGDTLYGYWPVDSKPVFHFETGDLPDDAVVLNAVVGVGFSNWDELPSDKVEYLLDHLVVEFAGPYGFGGNIWFPGFALSGGDYFASAAATFELEFNLAIGGIQLPPEAMQYIQTEGPTQVRLAFADNPEGYELKAVRHNDGDPGVSLFVAYE